MHDTAQVEEGKQRSTPEYADINLIAFFEMGIYMLAFEAAEAVLFCVAASRYSRFWFALSCCTRQHIHTSW